MITNHIIQKSIDDLRTITKVDVTVFDTDGNMLATTQDIQDMNIEMIRSFADSPADSQVVGALHLLKVIQEEAVMYIIVTRGASEDAYMVGRIAVSQILALSMAYKEHFDRDNFFQNLLLDNMLVVDIYNRAKKLRVESSRKRVVYLIEARQEKDSIVKDLLKGMFAPQTGDVVTAVDENAVILIKSLEASDGEEELEQIASTIVSLLNTEAMLNVRVAYGNTVNELRDVSKSYKEAKMALEVGKIFYAQRNQLAYTSLGIGRLIYQLPVNLCEIFIKEIFGDQIPEELDDETRSMLDKFFENNLNVSETSRELFVHRNTLVYRIEKVQKATGLDLRLFDDALTYKIAMMVESYLNYVKNNGENY